MYGVDSYIYARSVMPACCECFGKDCIVTKAVTEGRKAIFRFSVINIRCHEVLNGLRGRLGGHVVCKKNSQGVFVFRSYSGVLRVFLSQLWVSCVHCADSKGILVVTTP